VEEEFNRKTNTKSVGLFEGTVAKGEQRRRRKRRMGLDSFMDDQRLSLDQKMRSIFSDVQECRSCSLAKLPVNKEGDRLLGHGDPNHHVIFIAQNPSFRRVKFEEPKIFGTWQNRNDRLFIEFLGKVGIKRKDVFVTNLVKCSTLENFPPDREEILACKKFIMREIGAIKPRLMVTIGGLAHKAFKGKTGAWSKWSGADVFGIWHPSYLLRAGLEEVQEEYLKQTYLRQFKEISKHEVFNDLKVDPFEVKEYP